MSLCLREMNYKEIICVICGTVNTLFTEGDQFVIHGHKIKPTSGGEPLPLWYTQPSHMLAKAVRFEEFVLFDGEGYAESYVDFLHFGI